MDANIKRCKIEKKIKIKIINSPHVFGNKDKDKDFIFFCQRPRHEKSSKTTTKKNCKCTTTTFGRHD